MRLGAVWLIAVTLLTASVPGETVRESTAAAPPPVPSGPRYPRAMWLDEELSRVYTANEESDSVSAMSLVDGAVLAELALPTGGRPRAIAGAQLAGGGSLLAVSLTFRHEVALVEVVELVDGPPSLRLRGTVPVGRGPAGLLFAGDERRVLVACESAGAIFEIDTVAGGVARRVAVVEGPRLLALDRECGRAVLTVGGRDAIGRYDLASGEVLFERALAAGRAFNLGALVVANARVHVAHQVKPTDVTILPQTIVWGLVIVNRLTVVDPRDGPGLERATSLDFRHLAAGDPTGLAILDPVVGGGSPRALITSGGTGRLIISEIDETPIGAADGPLERVPSLVDVDVGRRPVDLAVSADRRRAWVLCALDDQLVEVDLERARVIRRLAVGAAVQPTAAHLGARVFYDSRRSRGGWYSCNSCHPDGGSRGHLFDTASDGVAPAKRAPDLRGTSSTGPWAWLAKFERLEAQVAASLESTMAVDDPPDPVDVAHVVAFLETLARPQRRSPGERLAGDPERGGKLFASAGCERCHRPPEYTVPGLRDVGVRAEDGASRFNPPSLIGVRERFRFLHDGRAASVEEVLRDHNTEGKHGRAAALGDGELRDLIAFLATL